jgi:hypothetical protein
MTLHIVLSTANRDGLVWVTERAAFLGSGHENFTSVEKLVYLEKHQVAFSGWGDGIALDALGKFSQCVEAGYINLSDQNNIVTSLRTFANNILPIEKKLSNEDSSARGLIVATISKEPRVYRVSITKNALVMPVYDEVSATAGDESNPANVFVRYYYPRCKRTIEELMLLGIHTVRLARKLNSRSVGATDAWFCKAGIFRQLNPQEIAQYESLSGSLDTSIFNQLSAAPLLT